MALSTIALSYGGTPGAATDNGRGPSRSNRARTRSDSVSA
jgi:hypothetical protein